MSDNEGKARGGIARAEMLTPEERKAIAKKGADARWNDRPIKAILDGSFSIGDIKIACAVLENQKRVLTQESFLSSLGRARKAKAGTGSLALVDGLPPFLAASNLKPFISEELLKSTAPVVFRTLSGGKGFGYDAELLPRACEVYLSARDAGALLPSQKHIAIACDLLMRGLAHVGILALVDEATGYQDARAKDALAKILEQFIATELMGWVSTFPDDFYRELFRLRGLNFPTDTPKRPQYFGILTNDIVYKRLAPGVLEELKRVTPKDDKGRRKHKYFQRLTDNLGYPKLLRHLGSVVTIMKLSGGWHEFMNKLDRVHPRYGETPMLPMNLDYEQRNDDGTGL